MQKNKKYGSSYIVFLEETEVTDHTNPDEHCGCSQQDAADIIVCQVLEKERKHSEIKHKFNLKNLLSLSPTIKNLIKNTANKAQFKTNLCLNSNFER